MRLSEVDLAKHCSAYVKQGRLVKYRFYEDDENSIHYKLHWKCENKELLTKEDIEYIKTEMQNVVIDNGSSFIFINFTGALMKW